jgi:hypothetical protein
LLINCSLLNGLSDSFALAARQKETEPLPPPRIIGRQQHFGKALRGDAPEIL